jgi:hypothetical protein
MNQTKTATKVQGTKTATNKKANLLNEVLINKATSKVINKPLKLETKNNTTFLAENVTGKQLLNLKFEANKLNKDELNSLSFQIKQFNKHGENLIKGLKGFTMDEVTPKNILPFLTDKEKEKQAKNGGKFSFYLVENLVIRYAKNKLSK